MDITVLIIFAAVYLGMVLGYFPGLAMDRTGVALLGAIALIIFGRIGIDDARAAVDIPTMALLFGLMIVSAQFRLSGFYSYIVRRLTRIDLSPPMFLALLIGVVALLSAILANDIVCLAVTPVLIESCRRRRLAPIPYLIALACAANIGSAATLIGNPQNMLIGQVLNLSFSRYLAIAIVPSISGLVLTWLVICYLTKGNWHLLSDDLAEMQIPQFNVWQATKGVVIVVALMAVFLFSPWPREIAALAAAGILLLSRHMRSREILGLVDWQLLVLFFALFIINYAMLKSGNMSIIESSLKSEGIIISDPGWLFGLSVLLSNLVSNVPATMLLLPSATHNLSGPILALSSTLAGNLFIVGSIANIIVIDQAARHDIKITWREHARIGVPVTILSLTITAVWLWLFAA